MKIKPVLIFFGTIFGVLLLSAFITIIFSVTLTSPSKDAINRVSTSTTLQKACVVGGCSAQLCGEEGDSLISTCEYTESYSCYKNAKCERQQDGKCGWTMDSSLNSCLLRYSKTN